MPRRISILAPLLLFSVFAGIAFGDIDEDLARLRTTFEANIAKTGEPQLRLYLVQLESLERTLASEGNYVGAIQARNEAEAVRNQIARLSSESAAASGEPGGTQQERIVFYPRGAIVSGPVWDQESETLRGWRSPEEYARWQLPNLAPGGYEVIVEYQAGASEGGEFTISEEFFYLPGQIQPTGVETVKKNLGTLRIRSGNGYLTIRASRAELGGLMHLKSIELIPAWR